jgi:hypothetical protein
MWRVVLLCFIDFFPSLFFWFSFVGRNPQALSSKEMDVVQKMYKKPKVCAVRRIGDLPINSVEVSRFRCERGYEFRVQHYPNRIFQKPSDRMGLSDFGKHQEKNEI